MNKAEFLKKYNIHPCGGYENYYSDLIDMLKNELSSTYISGGRVIRHLGSRYRVDIICNCPDPETFVVYDKYLKKRITRQTTDKAEAEFICQAMNNRYRK